jgi:hypothetical protein
MVADQSPLVWLGRGQGWGGEGRRREKGSAPHRAKLFFFVWFPIQTSWVLPHIPKKTNEVPSVVVWWWCCCPTFPERAVAASHARVPLARNPRSEVIGFFQNSNFVWRMNVTVFPRTWRRRPDPAPRGKPKGVLQHRLGRPASSSLPYCLN